MEKLFYPCEHDYDELEELICKDFQDKEPPDSMLMYEGNPVVPSDLEVYNSIFCH